MLGWSINLFRVFGIQLAVHASFVLLLLYSAVQGWQDGEWIGVALHVALTVAFFFCVILHELGHSLTARRYGIRVPRILLLPIGGMAEMESIPRQPSQELLITIAGPAVNFAIVLLLWVTVGLPSGLPWNPEFEKSFEGIGQLLLYWNGVMGLFNLVPVFPMDGGRILRSLLATQLPYLRATWWAVMVARVLAVGFIAWALYAGNVMLAVLFTFILFAGNAEYRFALRREQEEAYWRELARQAVPVAPPPLSDEPPIIVHGRN